MAAHDREFLVSWTEASGSSSDVYARVLEGFNRTEDTPQFGYLAEGQTITSEPLLVTLDTSGDQDQSTVATASGSGDDTAIIAYRDSEGLAGTDIAMRVLRIARP